MNVIIEIQQSIIQIKDSKIEEVIKNIIDLELVYHNDHNLLMYLKAIISLFSKTTIEFDDNSSNFSASSSLRDELFDIEKVIRISMIKIVLMHFR